MKKFIKIMTGFMNRMAQDHVSAFAAQAAFFILMSFVPFLMLLLPLVTYVSITKDMVVEILLQIMPDAGDFRSFLFSIIQEVYDKSTAIVPISAVFTLWSAGKGLQGLTNGVNAIYHVKETRNYVVTRIRSALYTLIFILAVISSLILLVFGNSIQKLLTKYIPTLAKVTAYVIVFPWIFCLSGLLRWIFQHVRKPDDDYSGSFVVIFLYVYCSDRGGNQCLF